MEIRLETKLEIVSADSTRASVHMDFGGGSFTISNILLKRLENGNWRFTMPLVHIGVNARPVITLQGAMKQAVFQALSEDHAALRTGGQRRAANSHVYEDGFPTPDGKERRKEGADYGGRESGLRAGESQAAGCGDSGDIPVPGV